MRHRTSDHLGRRTLLRTLAAGAVGAPVAMGVAALSDSAAASTGQRPGSVPRVMWSPTPQSDGLNPFEGIEADRGGLFPHRHYVYVEGGDHYRYNIWADDRDTTGGGDRQRTECRGMVRSGVPQKMRNGETWTIRYEMFMPASLHGTSRFTHIFQTKTPATNAGPWVTLDLSRAADGAPETLRARAYSTPGAPDIAHTPLAPLRDKWITVEWALSIGERGAARFTAWDGIGSGAPVVANGRLTDVAIPDQGDYVRPKWGIYRSVQSARSDIVDTHLLLRNFRATRA